MAIKGYTAFVGGASMGIYGGSMGATAGSAVCVALGIITAPTAGAGGLACALVGGTIGGVVGGYVGELGGEFTGELLNRIWIN